MRSYYCLVRVSVSLPNFFTNTYWGNTRGYPTEGIVSHVMYSHRVLGILSLDMPMNQYLCTTFSGSRRACTSCTYCRLARPPSIATFRDLQQRSRHSTCIYHTCPGHDAWRHLSRHPFCCHTANINHPIWRRRGAIAEWFNATFRRRRHPS